MGVGKTLSVVILFGVSFAGVFGLLAAFKALSPPTLDTARQELRPLYRQMDMAFEEKDWSRAVSRAAPDFVAVSRHGDYTSVADLRANLAKTFYYAGNIRSRTRIVKIKMDREKAIVTVRTRLKYDTTDNSPRGVSTHCREDSAEIDAWTKEFGQWRLHKSEETALSVHRNV